MRCNKKSYNTSTLVCPECGRKFSIPRWRGRARKRGHIKTVWCPYCRKMEDMKEYRYGDFYKTMSGEMIK